MMTARKALYVVMILSMILCLGCERPTEDEEKTDDKEYFIDDDGNVIEGDGDYSDVGGDDSDADGGGASSDVGGSSTGQPSDGDDSGDTGTGDDDDGGFVPDPSITDDRETPYNETDIVDDNDTGGETGSTDSGSGSGSGGSGDSGTSGGTAVATGDTITVSQFLNTEELHYVYVKGYIVGCCERTVNKADFTAPFTIGSNLLLADSPQERDKSKLMSVELKKGTTIRNMLDLTVHPEMLGRKILVGGYRSTYLGTYGIKGINKEFKIYQ